MENGVQSEEGFLLKTFAEHTDALFLGGVLRNVEKCSRSHKNPKAEDGAATGEKGE